MCTRAHLAQCGTNLKSSIHTQVVPASRAARHTPRLQTRTHTSHFTCGQATRPSDTRHRTRIRLPAATNAPSAAANIYRQCCSQGADRVSKPCRGSRQGKVQKATCNGHYLTAVDAPVCQAVDGGRGHPLLTASSTDRSRPMGHLRTPIILCPHSASHHPLGALPRSNCLHT